MYAFSVPCTLYQDTGYQGYAPEKVTITQPVKNRKEKNFLKNKKPSTGK